MIILDNILSGLAAALLLALGIVFIMNANLRADLATVNANALTLTQANLDLRDAAVKQNAAVEALKIASAAHAKAAAHAIMAASDQATRAKAEASAIAQQRVSGNDCADATKILQAYLNRKEFIAPAG